MLQQQQFEKYVEPWLHRSVGRCLVSQVRCPSVNVATNQKKNTVAFTRSVHMMAITKKNQPQPCLFTTDVEGILSSVRWYWLLIILRLSWIPFLTKYREYWPGIWVELEIVQLTDWSKTVGIKPSRDVTPVRQNHIPTTIFSGVVW